MNARKAARKPHSQGPAGAETAQLRSVGASSSAAALGRGAHFAKLSKKLGDGLFEARLFDGERWTVGLAPEVDPEFADRCMADQEVVLIGAVGANVIFFGALRTKERRPEDVVVVEAPRKLILRAGKAKLELSADGKVRLSANDVTVDAPREVRLVSAHVEIP